jgi:hypothetical protein
MSDDDKKTEQVKVWMTERLLTDLSRLADANDRKLSDYITVILEHHVYGHLRKAPEKT